MGLWYTAAAFGFFLIGGILVEIPIVMVFLSFALPWRSNRWAQFVAAILMMVTVVTGTHSDLDDYFHAGVEAAALLAILWLAWRWRPK